MGKQIVIKLVGRDGGSDPLTVRIQPRSRLLRHPTQHNNVPSIY